MAKYSETLTKHVMAPRNGGVMDEPDITGHAGRTGPGCVSHSISQGSGGSNRGCEVPHARLRADDRIGLDAHRDDRGTDDRGVPGRKQGTETGTQLVLWPRRRFGLIHRYAEHSESSTWRACLSRPEPIGRDDAHVQKGG